MREFLKEKAKDFAMIAVLVFSAVYVTAPVSAGTCSGGLSTDECNKICSELTDDALRAAAGCGTAATDQVPSRVKNIIDAVTSVVGILAVLVIAMAGQRYLTSSGDPGKIKQAKDMIVYAVIALVVAGLAYAIVTFISSNLTSNANTDTHTP